MLGSTPASGSAATPSGAPRAPFAEAGDAAGARAPGFRNHDPPVDVHRGASADDRDTTVTVDFDRPYERPPRLTFGRTGGGLRGRSFRTDGDGDVVGVALAVADEGGTVDLFVGGT